MQWSSSGFLNVQFSAVHVVVRPEDQQWPMKCELNDSTPRSIVFRMPFLSPMCNIWKLAGPSAWLTGPLFRTWDCCQLLSYTGWRRTLPPLSLFFLPSPTVLHSFPILSFVCLFLDTRLGNFLLLNHFLLQTDWQSLPKWARRTPHFWRHITLRNFYREVRAEENFWFMLHGLKQHAFASSQRSKYFMWS